MRTEEGVFSGRASFDPREFHIPKCILALAKMAWLRQISIPGCLRECTRPRRIQSYIKSRISYIIYHIMSSSVMSYYSALYTIIDIIDIVDILYVLIKAYFIVKMTSPAMVQLPDFWKAP